MKRLLREKLSPERERKKIQFVLHISTLSKQRYSNIYSWEYFIITSSDSKNYLEKNHKYRGK